MNFVEIPETFDDAFAHLKVIELGIIIELASEEEYIQIKRETQKMLTEMYNNKVEMPNLFDYTILNVQMRDKNDLGGSVSIDIYTEENIFEETHVDFNSYKNFANFRVINEIDGSSDEWYFPLDLNGLLEAAKKYNHLVTTFSFE